MKNLLPALLLPLALLGTTQPTFAQAAPAATKTSADTRTVSGRVTDDQGQALPGVTVLLKGTTHGTSTDMAGQYTLAGVPTSKKAVLVFSYIGYTTRELPAPVPGAPLNVVLRASQSQLNEVVVSGYGVQKHKAVTGSVSTVTEKELQSQSVGLAENKAARRARRTTQAAPAMSRASTITYDDMTAKPAPVAPGLLPYPAKPEAGAGDTYAKIQENAFHPVAKEPLSTFSLDVDNASYSNVRRFLNEGQLPPRDAVRVEEMLNYFHYQLPAPPATSPDPVRISAELSECPWAPGHQLARIGIQAKKIETASLPPANLVFWLMCRAR